MFLLVSCDDRSEKSFRWLETRGVEASGRSLVDAVTARDGALASRLLEAGVFTEHRDPSGLTPLGIAVRNHDRESLCMLLNAGADPNPGAGGLASVLGSAVAGGDRGMARMLIAAGARTDGRMPDGEAILAWAIRSGDREWIDAVLHSDTDPRVCDRDGTPLLHLAIRSGDEKLADQLLALGVDPAARDSAGFSVLHLALQDKRHAFAARLVAAGADPNAHGPDGRSLLESAVAARDLERIALLLRLGADPNHHGAAGGASHGPFAAAFDAGDSEIFSLFLSRGARPPGGTWDGWFERVLRERRARDAALLLRHGAASARTPLPFHPLEQATLRGDIPLAKLLLDYGFEPGRALHIAAARGDRATASLLLACGASPDSTLWPTKDTPLSTAIRGGHDRLALLLLQRGADPHLTPPEGQSLFHLAVARSCPETVRHLLAHGADPNAAFVQPVSESFRNQVRKGVMRWVLKNDKGATPLMLAADSGNIPTTRYLMEAGAKTNVRTRSSGLWPINFASRRSDVAMMRLFLGRDPRQEERRIEIRLSEQRARIYDAAGEEIFETRVSTGRKGYATPTGEYVITNKYRDWTSTLYHASMPYFQRLSCGDFGLHQGNVPGYPASHGCIRVPAGNAAKLFSMTKTGDRVTILP
ncbi:MAG: ankyrin repeat domain-containing protein [Akkermansiaceae bacterium]|nr:ankyrin repeat domain-containing protein [Akkermansiaceae bacterium]